jgi:hypothetical protein
MTEGFTGSEIDHFRTQTGVAGCPPKTCESFLSENKFLSDSVVTPLGAPLQHSPELLDSLYTSIKMFE